MKNLKSFLWGNWGHYKRKRQHGTLSITWRPLEWFRQAVLPPVVRWRHRPNGEAVLGVAVRPAPSWWSGIGYILCKQKGNLRWHFFSFFFNKFPRHESDEVWLLCLMHGVCLFIAHFFPLLAVFGFVWAIGRRKKRIRAQISVAKPSGTVLLKTQLDTLPSAQDNYS